jgi:hypothetical protein
MRHKVKLPPLSFEQELKSNPFVMAEAERLMGIELFMNYVRKFSLWETEKDIEEHLKWVIAKTIQPTGYKFEKEEDYDNYFIEFTRVFLEDVRQRVEVRDRREWLAERFKYNSN